MPAVAIAPLFVVMWSTGFIGAKLGLPYAEPMSFLSLRFALTAAALALWVQIARAPWPSWRQAGDAALIGVLVHGVYLGGVFQAIAWGTEAGVSALIVGLQPIVTAAIAVRLLGERLSGVQRIGMLLGLLGVALVVARKLEAGIGDMAGVALCVLSLVAISTASILQKTRAAKTPMRSGNLIQFASAMLATAALALVIETGEIQWTGPFLFALFWLVIVLSLGAIMLYYLLIERGAASNVASLFFLVPPSTAVIAWFLFDERLGPVEIAGMAVAALGVMMVNRAELFQRRGR
ncbi:MAG: DMT family transporter [Pseudomonadota bacterium]